MSPTEIRHLRCEYRNNPLGLDVLHPRFSWQLHTERLGARQTAYRVLVATNQQQLQNGHADLWDSGKVETDQSIHINYAGVALQARQRAYWQVTVWDETDTTAISTELAWFEMGLLRADDWTGKWIGSNIAGGKRTPIPVPHLRKAFELSDAVASARLYVTALGLFECSLNGKRIGEDVFAPGWTDYNKRVQYLTYDVTAHLMQGENVIGVLLGDGWAVGYIGWLHRQNYSDRPQLLAQLEITLMNGEIHTIVSNDSWEYAFGAITHSDFLQGEAYDARRELIGWDTSAFGNGHWFPVQAFDNPTLNIVAISRSPVRRMNELPLFLHRLIALLWVVADTFSIWGKTWLGGYDLRGQVKKGQLSIIRFAEVLNSDGTPYYTNLQQRKRLIIIHLGEMPKKFWESRFTFHGFRYVEIEGYAGHK
ncbi:MAG UNVERIFIED_CONTAM: family 78 glycoside hydrolase catalytic domain [Anaerolineae bacterium]|jgi:alpha-L-rhamnosidase